jgi:hypothetical protein
MGKFMSRTSGRHRAGEAVDGRAGSRSSETERARSLARRRGEDNWPALTSPSSALEPPHAVTSCMHATTPTPKRPACRCRPSIYLSPGVTARAAPAVDIHPI